MNTIDPLEHTGLIHTVLNTQTWLYGSKSSWTYDDAYQEAFMALIEALQTYDSTQGTVATYCLQRIKWGLFRAYQEQNGLIRKPTHLYSTRSEYRKIQLDYFQQHNAEPSMKYMAIMMKMTVSELRAFLDLFSPVGSLDKPLNDSEDFNLSDTIPDERNEYADVEYRLTLAQLRKDLQRMMDNRLSAIDQEILKEYYAWDGGAMPTIRSLAEKYKLSVNATRGKIIKALAQFTIYRRELAKNYPDIIATQIYDQNESQLFDLKKMKNELLSVHLRVGDLIHVNKNLGVVTEIDQAYRRFTFSTPSGAATYKFKDITDLEIQGRRIWKVFT